MIAHAPSILLRPLRQSPQPLRQVADAGLTVADIDGMTTMGDVVPVEVKDALGARLSWIGTSVAREGSGGHLRFVIDACMAKGLGNFAPMGGPGMGGGRRGGSAGGPGGGGPPGGNPNGWARDMEKGMFPLKATRNGETLIEVLSIDKKSLDATLFAPPAGYTEMGGGMGGGRPPQR